MDGAEASRRLKAARWIAGGVDDRGRVQPLTNEELAQREPLVRNRITANRLSEFERLISEPREMELRVIAEALGCAPSFLTGEAPPDEDPVAVLTRKVDELLARVPPPAGDADAEEAASAAEEAAAATEAQRGGSGAGRGASETGR